MPQSERVLYDANRPQYILETGQVDPVSGKALPSLTRERDYIVEYVVPADARQGARGTVSVGSRTSYPYPNYATLSTSAGDFSNDKRMISRDIAFRIGPAKNKAGEAPELSVSAGQSIYLNLTLRNPVTGKGGGDVSHDAIVEFRRPQ